VVGVVVVLAALWAVRSTPALLWVALLLGAPATILAVLEAVDPSNDTVVLVSAIVHAPFYFYVSYAMVRYVFADDRITSDEIYATGAAFTVVAWGFAYVYAGAQVLWAGSFANVGSPDRSWFELLFLSFTTLTSTGLSDVTPLLDHARSLVMVEQVTGVFYIAFVVARLVALTVRGRHSEGSV
jgi:CDP-diglyceride synthetase